MDSELREATGFMKSWVIWLVLVFAVLGVAGFLATRTVDAVDKGVSHYEDFQEMYTTTQKINADLATIRAIPETDKYFASFSKAAQVTGKKQQMTRWIEEYNAKSKMVNRSLWKSSTLPYQLETSDFANYKD